jgi:hypothetical protein
VTTPNRHDNTRQERRNRLAAAAIAGVVAGATKTITTWVLHYLTTNC